MRDEPVNDVVPEEVDLPPVANEEEAADSYVEPSESNTDSQVDSTSDAIETEVFGAQEAEAVIDTEPAANTVPAKKSKKPLIISLITAGVLAVLLGGGALAYNFWYQNPDKVVGDAIVHAITAKTYSATGTLNYESDDYKLKIEASGRSNTKLDSTLAVKLTYEANDTQLTFNGEGIFSAEGDLYVKLNDAKKLADDITEQSDGSIDFSIFDSVIEKIDGNWIKISKEDLGDVNEDAEKTQKCLADITKQFDTDANFRRSVENELKDLYGEHTFIIVGDKLGARTINGVGSLGYELDIDNAKAASFAKEFGETQLGEKLKDCDESIDFSDVADEVSEGDEESSVETRVELWVSRFGHTITEVNFDVNDSEENVQISAVINPTFNGENTIDIPTDVITVQELRDDIEKAYAEYYESYFNPRVRSDGRGAGQFN